jgi:hypothetical protein
MNNTSQFSDKSRGRAALGGLPGGSLLGRLVAAIIGVGVFGVAIFLGAIFLAVVIGLVLIAGLVISVRVWFLKRKMRQYARDHGDLEGEYVEVTKVTVSDVERRLPGDQDRQ